MSTLKSTATPVAPSSADAAIQPSVKAQAARQATTKKTAVKKTMPAKPLSKKLSATNAPDSQATVKKATVKKATVKKAAVKKPGTKTPRAKAFATTKLEKAVKTTKTTKVVKLEKARKPKLVRDSFTIPKVEYVVLEALKQRATQLNHSVKKSELLRAGIKALAAMPDATFLTALERVPAIKTGRPAIEK